MSRGDRWRRICLQASTSIGMSPLTVRVDLDPITGGFPPKRDKGSNESKV
jgi:hypothetical protein